MWYVTPRDVHWRRMLEHNPYVPFMPVYFAYVDPPFQTTFINTCNSSLTSSSNMWLICTMSYVPWDVRDSICFPFPCLCKEHYIGICNHSIYTFPFMPWETSTIPKQHLHRLVCPMGPIVSFVVILSVYGWYFLVGASFICFPPCLLLARCSVFTNVQWTVL